MASSTVQSHNSYFNMTYDEWLKHKKAKRDRYPGGEVPFGTAAEEFGRAAWNAALEMAAVECYEAEPESGLSGWIRSRMSPPTETPQG